MRKLISIFAAAIMAIFLVCLSNGTASAIGGEVLGCRVAPASGSQPITHPFCTDRMPPNPYFNVGFQVLNEVGSYSYAWTVPAAYTSAITSGCTATTSYCAITARNSDQSIPVSVIVTQGGASETLSATAQISQYCGKELC